MVDLDKLKHIINKRVVLIMLHGKSIEGLEKEIINFKKLDICYTSLNYFTIMEEYILNKINKKLDFVFDSSSIVKECRQDFEAKYRLKRLGEYLSRANDNLWVTTKGNMKMIMIDTGNEEFIIRFINKILLVDQLDIILDVPNSVALLLQICILGGARKIILCGFDGHMGDENVLQSYYKSEIFYKNLRLPSTGNKNFVIGTETTLFENQIGNILQNFKNVPPIINCSINSYHNVFNKINYKELPGWCK